MLMAMVNRAMMMMIVAIIERMKNHSVNDGSKYTDKDGDASYDDGRGLLVIMVVVVVMLKIFTMVKTEMLVW